MSLAITNAAPVSANTSSVMPQNTRAADGDYKTRSAKTSQVKDADGDYKPASATSRSASSVQVALTNLVKGG